MLLLDYWKVCPKFPNYEVSWSQKVRHINGKKIKNCYVCDGYFKLNVDFLSKKHRPCLHQMIGWTYVPNPDNKPELHHIDGIKYNNSPTNFMWLTKAEHIKLTTLMGQRQHKLKPDDVVYIRKYFWLYGKDNLAEKFSVSRMTILGIATGRFRQQIDHPVHHEYIGTDKIIIDLNTGVFYENANELSELIGVKRKEICRMLSGERPNKTPYRYANFDGIQDTIAAIKSKSKKTRPVAKFTTDGVLVERFLDIKHTGNSITRQRIGAFLNGRSRDVDGFYYKLIAKDGHFIEPPKFISQKKPYTPTGNEPTKPKPVIQKDQFGRIIKFHQSIREAARYIGDNDQKPLQKTLKRKNGTRKGFYFTYA